MVEVVFHVGAHKCATTAVQKGLERLAAVRPELLYVPPTRQGRAGAAPDAEACPELRDLIRLVGRGAEAAVQRDGVVDGLCRLIDRNAARERIVFSDEYILGGMPGLRWSFYPNAGAAREVIDAVARSFPTGVLLQSRESAGYLRSSYRFRVRKGMTLGYAAFLDRYDLGSISWTKLGETLFDGASYSWRVLPIERMADPAEAAATLRFVAPEWDMDDIPLQAQNESNRPLMRAATLILNRMGKEIDADPDGAPAVAFDAIETEVAGAEDKRASGLIEETLERLAIKAGPRIARLIRLQFEEERAPAGHLHALLAERFAPDYAAFHARYADES